MLSTRLVAQQQWNQPGSVMHLSDWSHPLEPFCSRWNFHLWHPRVTEASNWERHHYTNLLSCLLHPFPARSLPLWSPSLILLSCIELGHKTFFPTELLLLLSLSSAISHFNKSVNSFPLFPMSCLHHSCGIFYSPSRNQPLLQLH